MFKKIVRTFKYQYRRRKFAKLGVKFPPSRPFKDKVILPVIRKVMPHTIASEIVGVQPMAEEVGEVFKLNVKYEGTSDDT